MTIEQCYSAIESNYEEVLGRFAGNKMLVEKFARKFVDDPSYQMLTETLEKKDYEEAFRAAHTLKGVCANLGFTQLFFCYMFKSLIHDGCHMAVCQGVVNGFSISSKFDQ